MSETVVFGGWLALRRTHPYRKGAMRLTSKAPALKAGEISVQLKLSVPLVLFSKPTLRIEAEIPEGSVISAEIPAEVQSNIAEIVREQTGLRVEISVPEEEA